MTYKSTVNQKFTAKTIKMKNEIIRQVRLFVLRQILVLNVAAVRTVTYAFNVLLFEVLPQKSLLKCY